MKTAFAVLSVVLAAGPAASMQLTSADFKNGGAIAREQVYARCGGQNISPQLSWSGAPKDARSFALTMIDESVKPNKWSHWLVFGIPANVDSLAKGAALPPGAKAWMNDFGAAQYDGPCPPIGSGPHRYVFTIWALGASPPDFPAGAKASEIETALNAAALAKATLTGTYERD
ncbi:MAG: YbhB/YbcL family Raf kinase inhibitor-like protein [Alphaproteobacteria bacterium]|nr:YbhB/YbcL family Raf kinase inhibitor-like protein [Alphaproteobacteria bacterium]